MDLCYRPSDQQVAEARREFATVRMLAGLDGGARERREQRVYILLQACKAPCNEAVVWTKGKEGRRGAGGATHLPSVARNWVAISL